MKTLEDDLKAYYRSCRVSADPSVKAAVADLAADEWGKARAERGLLSGGDSSLFGNEAFGRRVTTYVAFVAGQARFMGVRSWLLQVAVVALVALVAWIDPFGTTGLFACLAGTAIAACGMPDVLASRMYGLVELERSCMFDARSVASARMVVLACANAVALFVLSCLIAGDGGTALTVAQIFAPYFITVGGCLAAARRMSALGALVASMAWASIVVAVAYVAAVKLPWVYELASWWIWAVVVVAAIAWALFEVRRWLSDTRISLGVLAFDSVYINR